MPSQGPPSDRAPSPDDASGAPDGPAEGATRDLVFVHSRNDDGGFRVLRSREDRIEIGEMRAPREGQPIVGELVKLEPTGEHDQLFACETIMKSPHAPAKAHPGPAQVATDAYRDGWDAIFGLPMENAEREPPDPSTLN
jgi:hypothetical protein